MEPIISPWLIYFIGVSDSVVRASGIVTVDNIHGANEFVKTNVQDYVNMLTDAINKVK